MTLYIISDQISYCGDWEPYKEEKCFKILDNHHLKSFDDAKHTCYQLNGSNLMSIRSQEEQDFLFNILNNEYNIIINVWLGIEFRVNNYVWMDSTALNYTNWANGNPINESGYDCVQLVLTQAYNGQWFNKPCNQRNVVVCEKRQNWMLTYSQETVMEMRDTVASITSQLDSTKTDLENTKHQFETTKTQLQNEILKATPAGTIAYFARTTPPLGWLKAMGQVVSRNTYSNLFASIGTTFGSGNGITTFALPDLRGEFIRGWSDGRAVDTNRAFGSFQWGSSIPFVDHVSNTLAMTHNAGIAQNRDFTGETFDGGFQRVSPGQTQYGITFRQYLMYYTTLTNRANITLFNVLQGTRPRNIAMLSCIKY